MSHEDSKSKKLDNPQFLPLLILLSIQSHKRKVPPHVTPLQHNAYKLKHHHEDLQHSRCHIVPNNHQNSSQA